MDNKELPGVLFVRAPRATALPLVFDSPHSGAAACRWSGASAGSPAERGEPHRGVRNNFDFSENKDLVAEGGGIEPPLPVKGRRISNPLHYRSAIPPHVAGFGRRRPGRFN